MSESPVIYTIGHSVHQWEYFIEMLNSFDIKILADVRRFPGSKKPVFMHNKYT